MIFADQRYARRDKRSKIPDWMLGEMQHNRAWCRLNRCEREVRPVSACGSASQSVVSWILRRGHSKTSSDGIVPMSGSGTSSIQAM